MHLSATLLGCRCTCTMWRTQPWQEPLPSAASQEHKGPASCLTGPSVGQSSMRAVRPRVAPASNPSARVSVSSISPTALHPVPGEPPQRRSWPQAPHGDASSDQVLVWMTRGTPFRCSVGRTGRHLGTRPCHVKVCAPKTDLSSLNDSFLTFPAGNHETGTGFADAPTIVMTDVTECESTSVNAVNRSLGLMEDYPSCEVNAVKEGTMRCAFC